MDWSQTSAFYFERFGRRKYGVRSLGVGHIGYVHKLRNRNWWGHGVHQDYMWKVINKPTREACCRSMLAMAKAAKKAHQALKDFE